jgi:DNA-binding beta-propeller fold protein YncE
MLTTIVGDRVYDYSHVVGGRQFIGIIALAIGKQNTCYTILRTNFFTIPDASIAKVNIGTTPGDEEIVCRFGGLGDAQGQFTWPAGIALDSQQNVYVTDEWLNRVSVFDADGVFLRSFGKAGNGPGELNRPSGIVADGDDNLLIVDAQNHRVQKFDTTGGFISSFGSRGDGPGQLNAPWGITLDSEGSIYVADHLNHRVQKFSRSGEYEMSIGSFGSGKGQFDHPTDVAVDGEGDIYVCDWANSRVQAFDSKGAYLHTFIGDAQQLSKWQQEYVESAPDVYKARRRVRSLEPEWRFALPMAVEFDTANSRLMVVDSQRWRIQIYNKLREYSDPQFNL